MANADYEQLKHHLQRGKDNGITKDEIVETVTQLAFYVGCRIGWKVLQMTKDIRK